MGPATLRERALDWLIGSDPGLLRLHSTIRTLVTLVVVLVILVLQTKVTGAPVTVAMLGVVIAMQAAMSVNEPDTREQVITMALLPVAAAAALTIAALLASHKLVSEIVFVVVIFVAAFVRRFGSRGMALGMVAFMAYFFALFLDASVAQLPGLVGAVVVGAACTLAIRLWVLPDRPARALRYTVWALWLRIAAVIDVSAVIVQSERSEFDDRSRRRLRRRTAQLNETVVMVEDQLEGGSTQLWPGIDDEKLILGLFDAELAVERVAVACVRAVGSDVPAGLVEALAELSAASSGPSDENLSQAVALAEEVVQQPVSPEVRGVALAVLGMGAAVAQMRALMRSADSSGTTALPLDQEPADVGDPDADEQDTEPTDGMNPATRQAIQATVAGVLAIIAGEMVSPARWYWAVITAFVVFAGATSRGEILTRGWQRLFGTILGVPAGVLVAAMVSDHRGVALALIFTCLFLGFYFLKVSYSVMMFCITTMLALLYGLLGQFSIEVLVLRLEETAVGTVIGVAVAALVLPTRTSETSRADTDLFMGKLSELIDASVSGHGSPTELARQLHRQLHQVRISAKPLTSGIFGIGGRGSIQRAVRLLTVCDHHGRVLARAVESGPEIPPEVAELFGRAGVTIGGNIDMLVQGDPATLVPAIESLDAAEVLVDGKQQLRVLHALRAIDGAVLNLALEAGLAEVA